MESGHGVGVRTALEASDRSTCDNPDTIGSLHIKHLHKEDFLDTGTIILPTKHNADKTKFKDIKKFSAFSRIILYPQLRPTEPASVGKSTVTLNSEEKFKKFQREMKLKLKTTLGPSKNLDAQNQMRMITTNIAVIYINCSLFLSDFQ